MKKFFSIIILIIVMLTLVACSGEAITPNEAYDMTDGIETGEYREVDFTVASYNIAGGIATVESIKGINDEITNIDVDIAGLQEVDNFSQRSGKKDYLGIFKNGVMSNVSYFPLMLKGYGDTYGIATVSKTEFSRTHSFKLPYPYKYEKGDVEKRIIMRSLVKVNGVQIAFYNTHLSYEEVAMPNGTSLREAQMQYILELLESDPCPYKIVTGDFNVLGFDEFEIFTKKGYKIVNNTENILNTYKGNDVNFCAIDNIIYSSNLELLTSAKGSSDYSDHDMLYAQFKTVQ